MKSTFYYSAILILLLSACNGASTGTADAPITTTQLDSEVHKSVAKIFIGGMTCKAGCGGKIEQELKGLAGVKTTETLFDENKTENMVSVEFDPATIDPKGMEACVEKIMDGKYVVTRIEVLNYRGLQSHGTRGSDVESKDMGFSELFKLLNVFQSLGRLLTSDM